MQVDAESSVSRDLAKIADRVSANALLRPEFCDRLARALSQLWGVVAEKLADDDVSRFDAILIRLVPTASLDTRVELADRIAPAPTPPRGVLLILAHDDIDVAGPILRLSPALGDDDLIDVARRCGTRHMGAIAGRSEISIRVCDVLVLRGDDVVRRLVCANDGARLSDKSFARLSLQARDDDTVGTVLIARSDVPDLVVRFLRENGSPIIRRVLAERGEGRTDPNARIEPSIRLTEEGWLEPYDFDVAEKVLERLTTAHGNIDGFVRKLGETDSFPEVVHVVARVSGLPLELVKHVMVSLDTDAFATIARAIGLKSETVSELLMIGPWLHRLDKRARDAAVTTFHATSPEVARTRLARWAGDTRRL